MMVGKPISACTASASSRLWARGDQADVLHGAAELVPVLRHVDGLTGGADHLDAMLLQHPFAHEIQSTVERRLPAHGGQQGVGLLLLDDAGHGGPMHRLYIDGIRHLGVGHDGGGVRVHQDDPVTLLAERLAGLGARIVELAGLADDDGTGADDQDALEVRALGHVSGPVARPSGARPCQCGAPCRTPRL
jgi:hypothetical protein